MNCHGLPALRITIIAAAFGSLTPFPRCFAADTAQATASVSLTIEQYADVTLGPEVNQWGQGHLPNGDPNYALDGAAPDFVGGDPGDLWLGCDVRKFAHGAIGRTTATVVCNFDATLKVKTILQDTDLVLVGSVEHEEIPATGWLGWEQAGAIRIYDEREDISAPLGEGLTMWLYVLARRQGLLDPPGVYVGTVVVELIPQ